jgi:hypothetical protein
MPPPAMLLGCLLLIVGFQLELQQKEVLDGHLYPCVRGLVYAVTVILKGVVSED